MIETKLKGRHGVHLTVDLFQGSVLTWVAGEIAITLADLGVQVSLFPVCTLCPTLEPRLRPQQEAVISDTPCLGYDVKLNHCLSQFLMQETAGEIDAELFVTNSHDLNRYGANPEEAFVCRVDWYSDLIAGWAPLGDESWEPRVVLLVASVDDHERRCGSVASTAGIPACLIEQVFESLDDLRHRLFDNRRSAFCRVGQAT